MDHLPYNTGQIENMNSQKVLSSSIFYEHNPVDRIKYGKGMWKLYVPFIAVWFSVVYSNMQNILQIGD